MTENSNMWWVKYRPQTLDDMCLTPEVRTKILEWKDSKEIPHLLLVGPPGCGKTTMAQIIVKDVLVCDYLYINASDENGIDTIRNKVAGFAQTKSFDGEVKVIILDEGDRITGAGLDCLRNIMETYAKHARFIITGNHKHKITKAINSRCEPLDVTPTKRDGFKRCLEILEKEVITASSDQKKLLVHLVTKEFPDLRKCIGEMQKFCINGVLNITAKTNTDELMTQIFNNIQTKKSLQTRKYLIENDRLFNGDYEQLLHDLLNFFYDQKLPDTEKKQSILTIADYLFKMVHVSDREICAFACIIQLENL